jgi:Ca2+-binding RTX toxin-like protein
MLKANVENLLLTGTANINGTGNASGNNLTGNSGANTLSGLDGNDFINGGEGADRMFGGIGDDIYLVDNAADMASEVEDAGTDTVMSSVTHSLRANVENLVLVGNAAIKGKGNTLGNTLTGNIGDNTLDGDAGSDIINGGAGRDVLFGGADADTFVFAHVGDTGPGTNRDQIRDFAAGDLIDLTGMEAETGVAFDFIGGSAFSGIAGEVRQAASGANTLVFGDTNGDTVADFSILLTGTHTLQSTDFVL